MTKNVILFGADMTTFVHIYNKEKDMLILGLVKDQNKD